MSEHLSRKELKQDKIRDSIEHGAEAVYSHGRMTGVIILLAIVVGGSIGGWRIYNDRKTVEATAALDVALKAFNGRIRAANEAVEPGEPALFPLEKNLGIEAGLATPALAERVGLWSVDHEQEQVRTLLLREHHVSWSVKSLRKVTMALRDTLTGIQRGTFADTHGWMSRLG